VAGVDLPYGWATLNINGTYDASTNAMVITTNGGCLGGTPTAGTQNIYRIPGPDNRICTNPTGNTSDLENVFTGNRSVSGFIPAQLRKTCATGSE
jgi:hypothetical protein